VAAPGIGGRYTRRTVLRAGGGLVALSALSPYGQLLARAQAAGLRLPDSLPDPTRAAGEPTAALPFDHIVVVMMENHSFDNYLGMLPRRGQPAADGFSFDAGGRPTNANPVKGGSVVVQRAPSLCQAGGPSQSWTPTHHEIDGGRMDGFAAVADTSMLYWDQPDLPFYYSLANTFTVGNRWFCSAPCQTYPNRRFLLAGTAFGLISTDVSSITQDPPNGTIFDRLQAHGVSWRDYFSDIPATGVIASIPRRFPANHSSIGQFHSDCAAGTLPAVSFVDSDIGVAGVVGSNVLGSVPAPFAAETGHQVDAHGSGSEEGPGNITLGETFVSSVVSSVLSSPAWPRILLVWLYDEHGGYYDHVPPPAAIPPDSIAPRLGPNDVKAGYDLYGPRVPAVVVSGHGRPHAVSDTVCDHTSILATIEAKWNLPALTHRDANANTLASFLDPTGKVTFPQPPTLAAPHDLADSEQHCSTVAPTFAVRPGAGSAGGGGGSGLGAGDAARRLVTRWYGRRHALGGALLVLYTTRGSETGLTVELLRGRHAVAHHRISRLGTGHQRVVLRPRRGRLAAGHYTLRVRKGRATLVHRRVTVG
jgi:phospholipase C